MTHPPANASLQVDNLIPSDKVYVCCMFVSLYVLYEIMWNTGVTLIYFFILYILICTSRSLLQCCTSKCNVVQS